MIQSATDQKSFCQRRRLHIQGNRQKYAMIPATMEGPIWFTESINWISKSGLRTILRSVIFAVKRSRGKMHGYIQLEEVRTPEHV
jgi:hypothetical protein